MTFFLLFISLNLQKKKKKLKSRTEGKKSHPFPPLLTLFRFAPETKQNSKRRVRLRPAAVPPARQGRHRRARRRAARGEAQRRREPRALGRAGPPAQGREVRDRDDGRGVGVGAVEGEEGKLARGGGVWRRRDERGRGTREREVFFVFSLSFLEDPTDNPLVKKSVSSFLFLL